MNLITGKGQGQDWVNVDTNRVTHYKHQCQISDHYWVVKMVEASSVCAFKFPYMFKKYMGQWHDIFFRLNLLKMHTENA